MSDVFAPPKSQNLTPGPSDDTQWAGFWRRVAAYMLDGLVLLIPSMLAGVVLRNEVLGLFAQFAIWIVYKILLESGAKQATLGKRAMGIKVVGPMGERITAARAAGRAFATILSGLIIGIGFLMAGLTSRKQALHDLIASTYVVRADPEPSDVAGEHPTMPMTIGVWLVVILLFIFPFGIGMVAAISIPAYQDFTIRSKMSEAISEASLLKPDALAAFAANAPAKSVTPQSPHVKDLTIDPRSRSIIMSLNSASFGTAVDPNAQVFFRAQEGAEQWACEARGVPNKYVPVMCRR
jgi:uncharacterized RDD family membrane protein YckC